MKRTTLTLDDRLLRALKKKSAEEGRTLQAVTNDLLRRALAAGPRRPYDLRLQGWKAAELPGVDLSDRDTLFDLMDGR
ncbi:MAG: type II toxin-antitoxin system VapB family antitoxin [Terriglobia bacterium]